MSMHKSEKLGKWLEKAITANKKDDRLDLTFKKVSELGDVEFVKTGNLLFDTMIGGFPRGRFSLLFGGPKCGKTTLMAQTAGFAVKEGLSVMIFEPENRAEKNWMLKFMDGEKVYITQCTGLGQALDSLVKIVESGLVDLVIVDSLAALAVKELKGKGTEGDHMALVARRLPQFFQMATEPVAQTKTAVVFVHQKRDSMDMYSGELETYSGGNALKHMVSLVLNIRRAAASKDADKGERFKDGESKIGYMANLKCIKGGIGSISEGDSIQIDFFNKVGFVNESSIMHFAIRNKIIEKPKVGIYLFEDSKGVYEQRGLNNLLEDIISNKELQQRILEKTKSVVQNGQLAIESVDIDLEFEQKETTANNIIEGITADTGENTSED